MINSVPQKNMRDVVKASPSAYPPQNMKSKAIGPQTMKPIRIPEPVFWYSFSSYSGFVVYFTIRSAIDPYKTSITNANRIYALFGQLRTKGKTKTKATTSTISAGTASATARIPIFAPILPSKSPNSLRIICQQILQQDIGN